MIITVCIFDVTCQGTYNNAHKMHDQEFTAMTDI
jgi:hypothetical protein